MPEEVRLHVEMLGVEQLDRKIARIKEGISNWKPIWPKVRDWFYQATVDQFASQGRGQWKPLAASTIQDRLANGFNSGPILERTGQELASFLGGSGAVDVETPDSLMIGSEWKVKSGRWTLPVLQARGTSRMPARPPIGFEITQESPHLWPSDAGRLRSIFSAYVHEVVTK